MTDQHIDWNQHTFLKIDDTIWKILVVSRVGLHADCVIGAAKGHRSKMTFVFLKTAGAIPIEIELCQSCNSDRIAHVYAKCSDCCWFKAGNHERSDYVPSGVGIGDDSEDYVELSYCLNCGKIQGSFPIPPEAVDQAFAD